MTDPGMSDAELSDADLSDEAHPADTPPATGTDDPWGGHRTPITADQLTDDHVGRFIECHDPASGANYGAEILRIARREDGRAPGVSVWLRHPTLPSGRRSRDGQAHVRFEEVFQLIDMSGR